MVRYEVKIDDLTLLWDESFDFILDHPEFDDGISFQESVILAKNKEELYELLISYKNKLKRNGNALKEA